MLQDRSGRVARDNLDMYDMTTPATMVVLVHIKPPRCKPHESLAYLEVTTSSQTEKREKTSRQELKNRGILMGHDLKAMPRAAPSLGRKPK